MDLTVKECIEHIVKVLNETKQIKKNTIQIEADQIFFIFGDIKYSILVEGPEDVQYQISEIKGVDLDYDFFQYKDDFGNYLYIEDYLFNTVLEHKFDYIKKVWKTLEKLEENDTEGDLTDIVSIYFGLQQ